MFLVKTRKNTVLIIATLLLTGLSVSSFQCQKQNAIRDSAVYKGRFEVQGICSNYTFSVVEGNIAPQLVEASWTDPQTNKTYTRAFGVKNPCDLPGDLKQGDVFYFKIIRKVTDSQCMVCMAYYPTPAKKLDISVIEVIKN